LFVARIGDGGVPRVVDNIDLHVKDVLTEALEAFDSLDACVGYFNLRGWHALQDAVADGPAGTPERPRVRLLIGMQGRTDSDELADALRVFSQNTLVDNATALRLKAAASREFRRQLEFGRPTASDLKVLRTLRDQLQEGRVRAKLHLRFMLHAKLYLCHRVDPANPRLALVGSSNLTFAGLRNQGELNVDVVDGDATEKLKKWFEQRWDDPFSVDITDELVAVIDESWASEKQLDPYLIHLKVAYHLSRDARAGLVQFGLPASMQQQLLQYQAAAVRITARNLMVNGGAMVGDVVGLGKTMIATAVALLLEEAQGYETLIICPKNLVPMWESYVFSYRPR
jgi:phosphatidylserine/phosphatidylglycerophosphate/cardiolipin synthase-like enzyme